MCVGLCVCPCVCSHTHTQAHVLYSCHITVLHDVTEINCLCVRARVCLYSRGPQTGRERCGKASVSLISHVNNSRESRRAQKLTEIRPVTSHLMHVHTLEWGRGARGGGVLPTPLWSRRCASSHE